MNLARFGVMRPVPVNLMMIGLIVAGVISGFTLTREFFPDVTPQMATISLPYPGATPEEVEEGLALKVEDAIADLIDVREIRTNLSEGGGGIIVEFHDGVVIGEAVDEVERAIDLLQDLPEESELIDVVEFLPRIPVIMVTLYGDASEEALKQAIHRVRDQLLTLPAMGEVLLSGVRNYELQVDVRYAALLEHGISLPQVADSIRAWMQETPGGSVRTESGNINVRTLGVPERAAAIGDIILKATPDGQALRVGDIAAVREGFVDTELVRRFNGHNAVSLTVFKVGDQDAVGMAKMVRAYVAGRKYLAGDAEAAYVPGLADQLLTALNSVRAMSSPPDQSPDEMKTNRRQAFELGAQSLHPLPGPIETHSDLARFIEGRLELLSRNALWGAMLVFATLLFFLNWRVAFWVGMGLVTALCGTLLLMSATNITLNLLTMFGLIVVIGLLVDDAIVIAENIQARHDRQEPALVAAINGTNEVLWPVVATILTSIVAFLPLTVIKGQMGDLIGALPMVVTCALIMSLFESIIILPSHMGHSLRKRDKRKPGRLTALLHRFEVGRDAIIFDRLVPAYGRLLRLALRYRYVSIAIALSMLIGTMGLVVGGRIGLTFIPSSDSETIIIDVRMPIGIPIRETDQVVAAIETAADAQPEVKSISTIIGERQNVETGSRDVSASHVAQVFVELTPVEERVNGTGRKSAEVIDAIRAGTAGFVDAADNIKYSEISGGPGGADLTFEVTGDNLERLVAAVNDVENQLRRIPGVFDVSDDNYEGQREVQISVRPEAAQALNIDNSYVNRQVRGALHGIDAHVYSDKREDIDVRVRLDEDTRGNLYEIENMWIIAPSGMAVPLVEIADLPEGRSFATIRRIDRKRAITITADCAEGTNPEEVMKNFPLAETRARHPGVEIGLGGRQESLSDAMSTLPYGFLAALVMIYVILAWLFGSYTQPLAVMLGIPFALIGVIWGHLILGYELTFLSLIGFVALSGIVVNDSLILVQFFNVKRAEGVPLREALVKAGMRRLRPIFLTTITTVLGLTPLMLEQSFQAKFLIPMAVSISFGLMSATFLILLVLPCIMVVIDDLKASGYFLWFGRVRPAEPMPATAEMLTSPD